MNGTTYERGIVMDNNENFGNTAGRRNIWLRTEGHEAEVNLITLQKSESMPEYSTIHNADLRVVRGSVGLALNDEEENIYSSGSVINIPAKTKIKLSNQFSEESTAFLNKI